jgi:hypothetical protein
MARAHGAIAYRAFSILLKDLVRCDRPLQMHVAVWRTFFKKLEVRQKIVIIDSSGMSHPTEKAALPSENISCHFFSRAEKPLRIQKAIYF